MARYDAYEPGTRAYDEAEERRKRQQQIRGTARRRFDEDTERIGMDAASLGARSRAEGERRFQRAEDVRRRLEDSDRVPDLLREREEARREAEADRVRAAHERFQDTRAGFIAANPLSVSPQERDFYLRRAAANEDARRFDSGEERFREAERNRHFEAGDRLDLDRTAERNRHGEAEGRLDLDRTAEGNRHDEATKEREARYAEAEAVRKAMEEAAKPKEPPHAGMPWTFHDPKTNTDWRWSQERNDWIQIGGPAAGDGAAAAPRPTAPASLGSFRED